MGSTLHVLLAGELVAGWGFPRRQLYVEFRILYDPSIWRLLPRGCLGLKDTTHPRPGVIRVQHYLLFDSSDQALQKSCYRHHPIRGAVIVIDELPAHVGRDACFAASTVQPASPGALCPPLGVRVRAAGG